jgi:hypothetical protein
MWIIGSRSWRIHQQKILYAAAAAEKISEYVLGLEQKREMSQTQEEIAVKEQIPHGERTYLAVPYEERDQAKAIGARWDAVKKAWYVGPGVEPEKLAIEKRITEPSEIIKQTQGFEISRLLLNQPREQEQHPGIDR